MGPGNHVLGEGPDSPGNWGKLGDIPLPIVKYREYPVQSIFSTLFGRWQQPSSLSLSVLQQLVITWWH